MTMRKFSVRKWTPVKTVEDLRYLELDLKERLGEYKELLDLLADSEQNLVKLNALISDIEKLPEEMGKLRFLLRSDELVTLMELNRYVAELPSFFPYLKKIKEDAIAKNKLHPIQKSWNSFLDWFKF